MADLFDVAAKITLDSSDYVSEMEKASSSTIEYEDVMKALQTEYNQTQAKIHLFLLSEILRR